MALFRLILKNTFRQKLRAFLTIAGIAIAILGFSFLRTVISGWYGGVEASSQNRLITRNAISLAFPLPLAYKGVLQGIPGVTGVSYGDWFGGVYIDEKNFFPQFAIDAPTYFDLYPEFKVPPEQMQAFLRERNAAIVGVKLATRYGWKIGDTVRLRGTFFPSDWDFVIRGIYKGAEPTTDETQFFFHWQYVEERERQNDSPMAGHVGWYVLRVSNPELAGPVSQAIDQRFKNSLAATLTESEKAFQMGFVSMTESILIALKIVSFLIIGVILVVLSNTMAMTVRERLKEFSVLKAMGFRPRHLMTLIAGESLLIALLGGGLGIAVTAPAVAVFAKKLENFFPLLRVETATYLACLLTAVGVAFGAAIFPIWRAITLKIADGLRRIG
ncbi:MAG: ABC transporter permease [Nitrospirae bacterium]|nr:ABC transporter permease [Nitrospirota bacterium]MBI3351560.1 ABC transporter permease [Nitrospirota bacterium]